jgi:signal transduction histidine kinase
MAEVGRHSSPLDFGPALWPHTGGRPPPSPEVDDLLESARLRLLSAPGAAAQLAKDAVVRARSLAQRAGAAEGFARALYRAADVLSLAGCPEQAYALCLETQALFDLADDRWHSTLVLQLRARCCLSVGEHERARMLLAQAIARFEKMQNAGATADCLSLVAQACRLAGEIEEAVDHAARAVASLPGDAEAGLAEQVRQCEADLRLLHAESLAARGDGEHARRELVRAVAVLPAPTGIDPARWTQSGAELLYILCRASAAMDEPDRHRSALRHLARRARTWRSTAERGLAWLQFADMHRRAGRLNRASTSILRAVRQLALTPFEPRLPFAHRLLGSFLEAQGRHAEAYLAFEQAARLDHKQRRRMTSLRAELLALDGEAEQDLLRREQTLAFAQRLSNVGHLIASVNHELNQPMASIRLLADTAMELIARGERPDEVREIVEATRRLSLRLCDVAAGLAAFPAAGSEEPGTVPLDDVVDAALETLGSRLQQVPCRFTRRLPTSAVRTHERFLVRVLVNLVDNALDVLSDHHDPCINFECTSQGGHILLHVTDNGPGLAEATHERLFQPFFSTKPPGRGLGLGLAMSRQVMREMGGELEAGAGPGGGARFTITLPACPAAAGVPAAVCS